MKLKIADPAASCYKYGRMFERSRKMRTISSMLCTVLFVLALSPGSLAPAQLADLKLEQCLGGDLSAPIRIEVFSDFECPACREFYLTTMRQVVKEYCSLDKVCVVYREFPLQGHKHARLAARYSKAAQRLGKKQWQTVMDALYEKQEKWAQDGSVDDVVFNALGSDEYFRLKKLLLDPAIDTEIDNEISIKKKKVIKSTPTFFVYAVGKEQKVARIIPYPVLKEFFDTIVK